MSTTLSEHVVEFGNVVLVRFPFTNQVAFKQRPAVVVSNGLYNAARPDVVIMAITSQIRTMSIVGSVWIEDWQAANLPKPSAVKLVFATVERGLLLKTFGQLQQQDQMNLRNAIRSVLG